MPGSEIQRPYSRGQYARALVINAAIEPFNVVVLAGMLIAGIVLGRLAWLGPLAVAVYAVAMARTFFDKSEQEKVLAAARARRRSRLEGAPRADVGVFGPPIAARIEAARAREQRIREAIERAQLPYDDVTTEVDAFVRAMEATGQRAQLLYEALAETPRAEVERRLAAAARDPSKAELHDALAQQVAVLKRMESQLERFYDEMDRMTVELDTIRGNLVSMSATTGTDADKQLADEVRGLRDEMGALADGMNEAYKR